MEEKFLITEIDRIIFVGEEEYTERKTVFGHNITSNELIFHFSGKATVYFNDKVLKTGPDIIRFLPEGKTTKYEVVREKSGACIDICFKTDRPISDEAFTLDVNGNKKLAALFKKIFSVWVAKSDGYYFECTSLLYKIFAELQKQNYIPEKQFVHIKPVADYINENFLSKNITLQELISLTDISYSYLKRLFIKRYGLPPKKYIIQLKINHACDLLKSDMYTVTQISEICGFRDVYFFSRQFKEYMGLTPTEYISKYNSSK